MVVYDYDGDKYAKILVEDDVHDSVKRGYLYHDAGRCGEVECLSHDLLCAHFFTEDWGT